MGFIDLSEIPYTLKILAWVLISVQHPYRPATVFINIVYFFKVLK